MIKNEIISILEETENSVALYDESDEVKAIFLRAIRLIKTKIEIALLEQLVTEVKKENGEIF